MKTLLPAAMIFCGLFNAVEAVFAQTWTQANIPFEPFTGIAASADGTTIVAVLTNGPVWLSTNSGYRWFQVRWTNGYYSTAVAASENGSVLVAATGYYTAGPLFVSTNSGINWATDNSPHEYWTAIACSADGSEIVAVASSGAIYISTDTGNTWTASDAPVEDWISVACSADGSQLAAVATNGPICVSTNAGADWMTNSSFSSSSAVLASRFYSPDGQGSGLNTNWQAVACSADKTKLVAVVNGGTIYISTDAGTTWTPSIAPSLNWQAVACSADGTKIIAAAKNGPIYTSTDAGSTWVSNNISSLSWTSVASSADGSKLAAAVSGGGIYTLYSTPTPRLNLTPANNDFLLSWTVPSTNFALQQNLDLTTTNWVALTNQPTLNLTNLNNEVVLQQTNSSSFFRLISQ